MPLANDLSDKFVAAIIYVKYLTLRAIQNLSCHLRTFVASSIVSGLVMYWHAESLQLLQLFLTYVFLCSFHFFEATPLHVLMQACVINKKQYVAGYIKSFVYANKPLMVEDTKIPVECWISGINPNLFHKWPNIRFIELLSCIRGGYFEWCVV